MSTDRLTPNLPRSVGFLPVFFPAERRFGRRSIQRLPAPGDSFAPVVILAGRLSRAGGTRRVASIPGNSDARCWANQSRKAKPSIGSRFAKHKKCRRPRRDRFARGRPPRALRRYFGNNGSMRRQSFSGIRANLLDQSGSDTIVRHESIGFPVGASPTRQLVAPAGSNRSGGGGNETVGAFDGKDRLGDSASQAGRNAK